MSFCIVPRCSFSTVWKKCAGSIESLTARVGSPPSGAAGVWASHACSSSGRGAATDSIRCASSAAVQRRYLALAVAERFSGFADVTGNWRNVSVAGSDPAVRFVRAKSVFGVQRTDNKVAGET